MEIDRPAWLDNEFLEKALRHGENDPNITVISSEIKPATVAGDNYASLMFRATLRFKRKGQIEETSIVIKAEPPATGDLFKRIEESGLFKKEISAYSSISAMEKLFLEISPKNFRPFAAKHIYSTTGPPSTTIVLQDLKRDGFKLPELNRGLDMNHARIGMKAIARFHATSIVSQHKKPGCFDELKGGNFCTINDGELMAPFITKSLKDFAEEMEKWPGYKERYSKILLTLQEVAVKEWVKGIKRNDSGFNVLVHGDMWFNNMMFKYSEETGAVEDIRFVDFQLTYLTSPAVDILYFMNSSLAPDVLDSREVLLHQYYSTLCETLTHLGHEQLKPTMFLLNEEVNCRCLIGVILGLGLRMFAFADRDKTPDMDNIIAKGSNVHISDRFREGAKVMLPLYDKWGWLESLK